MQVQHLEKREIMRKITIWSLKQDSTFSDNYADARLKQLSQHAKQVMENFIEKKRVHSATMDSSLHTCMCVYSLMWTQELQQCSNHHHATCMYLYMHTYMYILHMCIYVCIYTYIYTHAHTHVYTYIHSRQQIKMHITDTEELWNELHIF